MKTTRLKQLAKQIATSTAVMVGLAMAAIASGAHAQTASFDPLTNTLRVPSIAVGNTVYSNLVYRVDQGAVLSVGAAASTPAGGCVYDNITAARFNSIQVGMTLAQVQSIMGCNYSEALALRTQLVTVYTWLEFSGKSVSVYFDATGALVLPLGGGTTFKKAGGL